MYNDDVKKQLNELISYAIQKKENMYVIIIASMQENSRKWFDYKRHSVKTSYLARHELDEIISSFREYCTYLEVYTDIEEFLKTYYTETLSIHPTLIFETSSKGIGQGRDALVPAFCNLIQYPHMGSEVPACVICSCKYQWTSILRANNIPVPDSYLFTHNHWQMEPYINKKYIIKLNNECASIGLSEDSVMVYDGSNLTQKAKQLQADYKQSVIAQTFIDGYEVEVPLIANHRFQSVLPPIGLSADGKKYHQGTFFDYETIYEDDYSLYDFSKEMPDVAIKLQNTVKSLIDILDLTGYMRVDFRVCSDGRYYVIDINNDPCINSCGTFRKSLEVLGICPKDIAGILIGNSLI